MTSEAVTIEGSKQVKDLGLEDRFDVDVTVNVDEVSARQFSVSTQMELWVDVPFPFSMTPRPIIEATGGAVFQTLLGQMMPAFGEIMVADIEGWYERKP